MKKNVSPYLKDMLDNMNLAEKFVGNISLKDFIANEEKYYAVLRCIELVGEAGDRVLKQSPEIERKHPVVQWGKIIGMRVIMAHHYDRINNQKVWDAIKVDIPETKPEIEKLYNEIVKEESIKNQTASKVSEVIKKDNDRGFDR